MLCRHHVGDGGVLCWSAEPISGSELVEAADASGASAARRPRDVPDWKLDSRERSWSASRGFPRSDSGAARGGAAGIAFGTRLVSDALPVEPFIAAGRYADSWLSSERACSWMSERSASIAATSSSRAPMRGAADGGGTEREDSGPLAVPDGRAAHSGGAQDAGGAAGAGRSAVGGRKKADSGCGAPEPEFAGSGAGLAGGCQPPPVGRVLSRCGNGAEGGACGAGGANVETGAGWGCAGAGSAQAEVRRPAAGAGSDVG